MQRWLALSFQGPNNWALKGSSNLTIRSLGPRKSRVTRLLHGNSLEWRHPLPNLHAGGSRSAVSGPENAHRGKAAMAQAYYIC